MAIDLTDVQGNLVTGYPPEWELDASLFTYLRIREGHQPDGRRFLGSLVEHVTHACHERPDATLNLAISHPGLAALGVPSDSLESFPVAFRQGMRQRASLLDDDDGTWDKMWRARGPVHLLVSIHARPGDALETEKRLLRKLVDAVSGLELMGEQPAGRIEIDGARNREHFGFADGLSNPAVDETSSARDDGGGRRVKGSWEPLAPGEFLLGNLDEAGAVPNVMPAILGRNGSFLVYRKLHQDVALFRETIEQRSKSLGMTGQELEAKMVGRSREGAPLTRPGAPDLNDFTYEDDPGTRCPMGSHIRRMHPRTVSNPPPPRRGWKKLFGRREELPDLTARHRIIRRGVPYGAPLPEGSPDDGLERGLIFVALNADIERQFEFLQTRYANDGDSSRQGYDRDPIVGANEGNGAMVIPGKEGEAPRVCEGLPAFVKMCGGDYFFAPSLSAVRWIAEGRWQAS